jgi:hypothetical protein
MQVFLHIRVFTVALAVRLATYQFCEYRHPKMRLTMVPSDDSALPASRSWLFLKDYNMALDQPAPCIPYVDPDGVLTLEALAGRVLPVTVQLANAPTRQWLHPLWRGTDTNGEVIDQRGQGVRISDPNELVELFRISAPDMALLDQGFAMVSFTLQPAAEYQEGFEESRRTWCLVGARNFPGAGINVPVIKEAHEGKFARADIPEQGASVTLAPWQAMQIGDVVTLKWRGFRATGQEVPYEGQWVVTAADLDRPLAMTIPKQQFNLISNGRGELSYAIAYAGGGNSTTSPVQHFLIVAAPDTRLPALQIVEQSGDTLDPSLLPDILTYRIPSYSDVREGDVLVIYAQQAGNTTATGQDRAVSDPASFPVTSVRLDRSTVDSGQLQCEGPSEWLFDHLDSRISLSYHLSRPGLALASEPLILPVSLAMVLPPPIVEGASGAGTDTGDFKAETTGAGIKVWVPSLAVYPEGATLQMHWEGPTSNGSQIIDRPTGDVPPAFLVDADGVAPNLGKTVRVFYRVKPSNGPAQDSDVFSLKVLPVPERFYPLVHCEHANAAARTLSLRSVPSLGTTLKVAPWVLIASGQKVDMAVAGTLKTGMPTTTQIIQDFPVSSGHVTAGLTELLEKSWLTTLQINSQLTFTVKVTADDGLTYVTFPRLYLTLLE